MNFITKPLSNTNVYSDKLQIVKSKKKLKRQIFLRLYIFRDNGPNVSCYTPEGRKCQLHMICSPGIVLMNIGRYT